MKPATELIHGDGASHDAEPLTTPIYETTTFVFENAAEVRAYNEGKSAKFLYSRYANPTVLAVEQKIARARGRRSRAGALERPGGDDDGADGAAGGGRRSRLQRGDLRRHAASARRSAPEVRRSSRGSCRSRSWPGRSRSSRPRRSWSGSSRRSIRRCAASTSPRSRERLPGARRHLGLDNTFASPINQQPIALGVDLVMHSATKYLNGHSDVTAGALAGRRALMEPILDARKKLGTVLDPHAAYALGRGLKTLPVRIAAAQRQRDGGRALACRTTSACSRVYYPGLEAASGSRARGEADARVRRDGVRRRRRRLRSRRARSSTGCRSSSAPPASAASRACAACRC